MFIQCPEWSEKTRLSMATVDEPGHINEEKTQEEKEISGQFGGRHSRIAGPPKRMVDRTI